MATFSSDLIWEITRGNSATLVKRAQSGGVSFSRDQFNLKNQYSRKYEGLVADKAIGVQPGQEGGVVVLTKKADKAHQPAAQIQTANVPAKRSNRKTYAGIINSTAGRNYRSDLRYDAVARASAIRKSQRPVKADQPKKARGSKMDLFQSKAASWRDTIQLRMGPTAVDPIEIPEVCREEVVEWDKEVVRVSRLLYELLSEGLGLGAERFREMGLGEGRVMVGHYYPFCPQPDLTVGLNSHADPGALTVVLQDHIGGLQVETPQGWIHVKPQPHALVINIGDFLQIISNETYKSAHHRVLANHCNEARVSIAVFLNPSDRERLFGPLPELTSTQKPALYKNFTFHEFMTRFFKKELDGKSLTNFFRQ